MPSPEFPKIVSPNNTLPYLVASGLIVLLGCVLVLGIIMLRPTYDPLVVIGAVTGLLAPTLAAIQAYLKSQETHLSVNSRLDAWMKEHGEVKRMEGVAQEQGDERARVIAAAIASPPVVAAIAPVATEVVDTRVVEVSKQAAQEISHAVSPPKEKKG